MRTTWIFLALLAINSAVGQHPVITKELVATNGLPAFVESTIEASSFLRRMLSPVQKYEFTRDFARFKDELVIAVETAVTKVCDGFYSERAVVKFKSDVVLLILDSSDGTRENSFSLRARDFSGGLSLVAREYSAVLPSHNIDPALVELVLGGLSRTVSKKSFSEFYRVEEQLGGNVRPLPVYEKSRIEGRDAGSLAHDNATLDLLTARSDVVFVCAKAICPNIYYSIYRFDSSMGPAVFVVYFEDIDGKPLVISLDFAAGLDALSFAMDITKAGVKTEKQLKATGTSTP